MCIRLDTIPECDRQTDGRTDRRICHKSIALCMHCMHSAIRTHTTVQPGRGVVNDSDAARIGIEFVGLDELITISRRTPDCTVRARFPSISRSLARLHAATHILHAASATADDAVWHASCLLQRLQYHRSLRLSSCKYVSSGGQLRDDSRQYSLI